MKVKYYFAEKMISMPAEGLSKVVQYDYPVNINDGFGTVVYGHAIYDRVLDDSECAARNLVKADDAEEKIAEIREKVKELGALLFANYEKAEARYQELKKAYADHDDDYPNEMAFADGYREAAYAQFDLFDKNIQEWSELNAELV